MDYSGEDSAYYNNCNTYYDPNYNQNISYDPSYYPPPEYYAPLPRIPDIYQCNGVTYTNEQLYDPRGDQPFDKRGYQNYSEDELVTFDFMNQGKPQVMNQLYPTVISNGFAGGGNNVSLQNEANERMTYRSGSSRRTNQSNSAHSSMYPKNNGLIIHINGKNALINNQQRIRNNYGREESVRSWAPLSTNRERINENNGSYMNEHEEEAEEDYSGGYQQFETTENGRTTIISINCNNMKNTRALENSDIDNDTNSDDSDSDNEDETSKKQTKKPTKPKKIFMGKYLFSDIKKSLMCPLTVCAPHPTLIAPNPGRFHYKIASKSRGEKNRKPEIVVRY